MYLLITYDITSDKKRRKIDKVLSSYGVRVNFSVFEVQVHKHQLCKLKEDLIAQMGERDSVRLYFLNKTAIESAEELNPKRGDPFSMEESYVL